LAARGAAPRDLMTVLDSVASRLQPAPEGGPVFTDDWAPIEQITNWMVIRFALSGQLDQLKP
jgi:hypothetical protein